MSFDVIGLRAPLLAACLVLLLAAAASALALPSIDEFCFAQRAPLEAANDLFYNWSGRWLGMFSLAAVAPDDWQPLITLLAFPIYFVGFYAAAATATERPLLPAILMLAVFWSAAPHLEEAFYYLAGIVMYAVPFAFGCVAVWLLSKRSAWAVVPAAVAPLFNELASVVLVAGLLPFVLRNRLAAATAAATFVVLLFVVLSPGNAARAAILQEVPISPAALAYYVARPYDTPWPLLFDFRLWAMAAVFALMPVHRNLPWFRISFAALLALGTATVAVTFAVNMAPQGRVLDFLFAGTVAAVGALSLAAQVAGPRLIASLALAGGLLTAPNVGNVLRGGWEKFQQRDERLATVMSRLSEKDSWVCTRYYGLPPRD